MLMNYIFLFFGKTLLANLSEVSQLPKFIKFVHVEQKFNIHYNESSKQSSGLEPVLFINMKQQEFY